MSWVAAAVLAVGLARLLPRKVGLWVELAVAIVVAVVLGLVATGLDFGGWGVFDPRAFALAFFGSVSSTALVRIVQLPGPLSKR